MNPPAPNSFMARSGATPGKLALIGVLALILAYVIISQLPSRKRIPNAPVAPASTGSTNRNPPAQRSPKPAPTASDSEPTDDIKPWPKPDMDQVVLHDPFQTPIWAQSTGTVRGGSTNSPQMPMAARDESLAKLRELGAAVIIEVDGEPLALVGEQQVRVGDHLEGFRVQEITKTGIVLANEGPSP